MFNKFKKAFTLAEVLVCLTIVGVIAALTTPILHNTSTMAANVESVKKAFIVLSEAVEMANLELPYSKWKFDDDNTDANFDRIVKHINTTKVCKATSGCWGGSFTSLNGESYADFGANGFGAPVRSFVTPDGLYFSMDNDYAPGHFAVPCKRERTIVFAVDVNGKKGPAKVGRDIFFFVLGDNGIEPAGQNNSNCKADSNGLYCTAKILKDGVMNY